VALFSDAFAWAPKQLRPVLERLGIGADGVVFVGDSVHDLAAARSAGVCFAAARWNPRASTLEGDLVLAHPLVLLDLL
jgi:phosphoglycolate phosphatase-like HAD superfamily hydrolase